MGIELRLVRREQMPTGGRERMTYHTAATKATGPALYVAAASAVASLVFAIIYLISYLCSSPGQVPAVLVEAAGWPA